MTLRGFALIIHFIGLAMGIGTGFAFMFLGIASSKMEPQEAKKFMLNTFALGRMGQIGLALLILSGGFLITPYLNIMRDMPLLIAKLTLVAVLVALVITNSILAKKVRQGEEQHLKKVQMLGRLVLLTGLAIIGLAVSVFQ